MTFARPKLVGGLILVIGFLQIFFFINYCGRCEIFERRGSMEVEAGKEDKLPYPRLYPKTKCSSRQKTKVQKSDLNTAALFSYRELANKEVQKLVAERHHGNFMPVLNVQQKADYMYLYLVVRDAFISRKIEHFLVNGAVLGIFRHGGLVPWDHDIDLGVFIDHRKEVDDALSCVEGFTLTWSAHRDNMHARFTYAGRGTPFVDFYVYGFDNHYVYGLNSKHDMNYPWRSVFPLQEVFVEGVPFYVPRDIAAVAKFQYEPKECVLGEIDLPVNKTWAQGFTDAFSLQSVKCSELSYMYKLKNI